MTEPTPITEDGEVIGIPPNPPTQDDPPPPAPPVVFLPPPVPEGDEVDPADL